MRSGRILPALAAVLLIGVAMAAQTQPRKLKVHISVDMEGIAGVVTGEQLGPTGFEYARAEASMIMNFIGEYRPDITP